MQRNSNEKKVSIVVCTYNPVWEKLKLTLDSCVCQKNVDLEIIITDDGSAQNLFGDIEQYFNERNFKKYKLISAVENKGTVKNYLKGTIASGGKYIKSISPGDFLSNENILGNWLESLIASNKKWSFSDAYYYSEIKEENPKLVAAYANPQMITPYLKGNEKKQRWFYVGLQDLAVGAAILGEKEIILQYLKEIEGKVKYAEDSIFRLMVFDGYPGHYFNKKTVYYEYGMGISTAKNSKWEKILKDDLEAANQLIEARPNKDEEQKRIIKAYQAWNTKKSLKRYLKMPRLTIFIAYRIKCKFFTQKTATELDEEDR